MRGFKLLLAGAALAGVCAAAVPAKAGVINYAVNGSFETFTVSGNSTTFTGWTSSTGPGASGPGYGPEAGITDGATKNRYNDIIAADNATSPSPDAAGTHALYLVDDVAYETLTQIIYLPQAGIYEAGFDALNTGSGANNANNSTVSVAVAGVTVVSGNTTIFGTNAWTHESANISVSAPGYYSIQIAFQGGAGPAKDVMVDKVYVGSPSSLLSVPVDIPAAPEPWSLSLLASALGSIAVLRRRRAVLAA